MGRKKTNPGIYLYPHDILSSPRCRSLTPGGAGIYFFLFLRLCDPPIPGAYRLRDWEPHPKWAKSDTRKCLLTSDKRQRLTLFAKWLAKNDLPWTKNEVLPYLQELYDRGIIIVEGDMLIQPRLYVDSGFEIPDIDHDGEPVGSILDDPVSGQMRAYDNTLQGGLNIRKNKGTINGTEKGTLNGTEKSTKKPRVGAGDAHARQKRVGVRDIINKERGAGETASPQAPLRVEGDINGEFSPESAERARISTQKPLTGNLSAAEEKRKQKPQKTAKKTAVADNPPTLEEVQAYFDERATQGKPFLYITAEGFYDACEQSGWRLKDGKPMISWQARVRTFESFRKEHGDRPVGAPSLQQPKAGDPVAATKPRSGKYNRKW